MRCLTEDDYLRVGCDVLLISGRRGTVGHRPWPGLSLDTPPCH